MIFWLDHRLFGSGSGLGTPFHDGYFYWLVDTAEVSRSEQNGQIYCWSGWFGSQLASFQWTHPKPGERRVLAGREFKPFSSRRRGPRVMVSWEWLGLPGNIDEANAALGKLKAELGGVTRQHLRPQPPEENGE